MNPVVPAGLEAALSDRYRLERELGAGGMATVYLARDLKHDRDVALKVLRPELASAVGAERFLAEIRTASALQHPHILPLFDSGQAAGFLYFAMPYVEGESLRDRLTREGQLPIADALRIAIAIAGALDYAHRHQVIHRDIKPDNILLHEGNAILADFGIALAVSQAGKDRLTATGLSIGTPQYMSPEQATGNKQLDGRSDIYSLGAVLYEMLAGEAPFTGPSAHAIIAKLLTEHPIRLRTVRDTVPGNVDAAVQRALATAPADRFATAAEFVRALEDPAATGDMHRTGGWTRSITIGAGVLAALGTAAWWTTRDRAEVGPAVELKKIQLTFTGNASLPALSPDGKRVAYLVKECGEFEGCVGTIMITDVPATTALTVVREVAGVDRIQWTADGRFLMYTAYYGARPGSFLVSTLGGTPRFMGKGAVTQLGATDTLIVAEGLGEVPGWLRVVPIASGVATDSIQVPRIHDLGWDVLGSPAGDRLAVLQYGDSVWTALVVDRTGVIHDSIAGTYRQGMSVAWAPTGDALVVTSAGSGQNEWDLLRFPIGGSRSAASVVDTIARQWRLAQGLIEIGRTGAAAYGEVRTEWTLVSFSRPADRSENMGTTALLSGTGFAGSPRVDAAGKWILMSRPVGSSDQPLVQLIVLPLEGGEAVPIGPSGAFGNYNWSADGSQVLATVDGTDSAMIMTVDPRTGQGKALGGQIPGPATGLAGLHGGGAVTSTTTGERLQLHIRGVPGRADTSIVPTPNGRFAGRGLRPRPDGQTVATVSFPLDSSGISTEFLEIDLPTGLSRVLARFPMADGATIADWTDNTHLDFFRPLAGGTGWYRLETTTGKVTQVAKMSQQAGSYDVSADGHRGAAIIVRQRSDIILIPNFSERLK